MPYETDGSTLIEKLGLTTALVRQNMPVYRDGQRFAQPPKHVRFVEYSHSDLAQNVRTPGHDQRRPCVIEFLSRLDVLLYESTWQLTYPAAGITHGMMRHVFTRGLFHPDVRLLFIGGPLNLLREFF